MSDIIIHAENIGKLYKLGEIGTGTISHDLNRWWARLRGKEDPFAKIGQINDRTQKGDSDYVWALQEINFEVRRGEVMGIIGRNGAGKSTLLKILSKVTTPTTGQIKIKGRIASLLEVGTGFHPELTGRENIFLNGAILGMTKTEIRKKFDEIVDFAGVERYIDTPVKRYSSGMYVRLAFAVAAFLEPEILIVDEVLAVGDTEFQKKCLGRMKDVSLNEGRTVLFVSHNMGAVNQLCNTAILLSNGCIMLSDKVSNVVDCYRRLNEPSNQPTFIGSEKSDKPLWFKKIITCDNTGQKKTDFFHDEEICISFTLGANSVFEPSDFTIFLVILNSEKVRVGSIESQSIKTDKLMFKLNPGILTRGFYSIHTFIHKAQVEQLDCCDDICSFEVIDNGSVFNIHGSYNYGSVFLSGKWIQ
jgi:lipopolysaccharide transport system ATP-binding protein